MAVTGTSRMWRFCANCQLTELSLLAFKAGVALDATTVTQVATQGLYVWRRSALGSEVQRCNGQRQTSDHSRIKIC